MHLPRNPPRIEEMISDNQLNREILSDDIAKYAKDFNEKYLHWSEVRLRGTGTFNPDVVWARMKLVRSDISRTLVFGETKYCYLINDAISSMLHEFNERLSRGLFLNNVDRQKRTYYSVSSIMEESIASSQMEGAVTTTKKAKEMLRKNIHPRDRSERMILNNYRAMMFIKEHTEEPLSQQLITDIHRIVTDGTLEERYMGIFRDNDDVVVQDATTGEVYHQPIPWVQIKSAVNDLCDFINNGGRDLHPVIKGIILHYTIAFIHPFEDGNGRVARTLFYWYMIRSGYWAMEYLALSRYIKEHKGKYEESYIFGETDGNDMTYFFLYNLKALSDSLDMFIDYLKRKTEEERSIGFNLSDLGLNARQIEIVSGLVDGGTTSVRSIKNQYGVSMNTARSDIRTLLELGLLSETGREVNMKIYSRSGKKI